MHQECIDFFNFVKKINSSYFFNKIILEVGVDRKQNLKDIFFENCIYYCNSITENNIITKSNKEINKKTSELDFSENYFDTIISSECFQYDADLSNSIIKIYKMLKPNGLFLFTAASEDKPREFYYQELDKTCFSDNEEYLKFKNYYKSININELNEIIDLDIHFIYWDTYYNSITRDLYFWGIKRNVNDINNQNKTFSKYIEPFTINISHKIYNKNKFIDYYKKILEISDFKTFSNFFSNMENLEIIYRFNDPKVYILGIDNINYINFYTNLFFNVQKLHILNSSRFIGNIYIQNKDNFIIENNFNEIIISDYILDFNIILINGILHQKDFLNIFIYVLENFNQHSLIILENIIYLNIYDVILEKLKNQKIFNKHFIYNIIIHKDSICIKLFI
jgi:SAM-dependent methyltransferase